MKSKKQGKIKFKKVVSEQLPVNPKRGGGIIKIDAWENEKGQIVKYSMTYINHLIFSGDNGRVLGYDNFHRTLCKACFLVKFSEILFR